MTDKYLKSILEGYNEAASKPSKFSVFGTHQKVKNDLQKGFDEINKYLTVKVGFAEYQKDYDSGDIAVITNDIAGYPIFFIDVKNKSIDLYDVYIDDYGGKRGTFISSSSSIEECLLSIARQCGKASGWLAGKYKPKAP